MKYIMDHLTEATLVCSIVIALILIFGNITYTLPNGSQATGFNVILGKVIAQSDQTYADYQDDDILQTVLSISDPVIEYTDTGQSKIRSGTGIQLLDYFYVTYGNGNIYKASDLAQANVLDILDPDENSILYDYDTDQKTIIFSSAGIYTIKLHVSDDDNRETTAEIKIPVEEGM